MKLLHADDFLCERTALEKMAAVMEGNPAISLVSSARRIVDEAGNFLETWSCFEETRPISGTSVITRCLREQRNLIGGPSAVMLRRDRSSRGFSTEYFVMADLEMWFHVLELGCFGYVPEALCAFRSHGRQQTEKDRTSMQPAMENYTLVGEYLDKQYVRIRPWMKRYLRNDALHRIAKRSRKLGVKVTPEIQVALGKHRGFERYRRQTTRVVYEAYVKQTRLFHRHLKPRLPMGVRSRKKLPLGINVAGFMKGEYGIGDSSRAMCLAIEETGLPCAFINVHSRMHSNSDASFTRLGTKNPYRVNLMTFSFDYSRRFARDMGHGFFDGRHNIGLWYWEQEHFPARWHSAFDYYDEIWVPTGFIRDALSKVSPIPVRKVTYPLRVEESARDRAAFGLREDSFVFLFNFDFLSTTARKNPEGVIKAFLQAFHPAEKVTLVLKSINWEHDRMGSQRLRAMAEGRDVLFAEAHLPGPMVGSLFASADCYVSLHRSEGLGLGMARSMYLGKPVIATGYSGNLDYMNAGNSRLIGYKMVMLEETSGPYEAGSFWAEPDGNEAAEQMRWVFDNREESAAMGCRAARDIRQTLDPERARAEILARVNDIGKADAQIRQ